MHSVSNKYQQGIALIQVLIIAIILTMLGIFINQSVREQVGIAGYIQNNQKSELLLESAEAELLHALLTNKRYSKQDSENEIVANWNFYGEPFNVRKGVEIVLQDLSGLLSINYMNQAVAARLLEQLGHDEAQVRVFFDSLKDWKDEDDLKHLNGAESNYYQKLGKQIPRNNYLQSYDEVSNVRGGKLLTQEQWQSYFSLGLISRFNPLNAPELLLKSFLNNEIIWQQVIELRNQKQLNMSSFFQLTGIDEDEAITFTTGRKIKVNIIVKTEKNKISKSFQVELRPNSTKRPVIISKIKWNEE